MARVTIGLPVYNGEKYVESAVESLLSQSYSDIQLIIADNASTDSTPDLCQKIANRDSRVRFVQNATNIGGWRNHNLVLDMADTELFMWAGHDDIWDRRSIQTCVNLLDSDSEAIMAFVGVQRIDGNGNPIDYDYIVPDFGDPRPSRRFQQAIRLDYSLELFYSLVRTDAIKRTRKLGQFSDSDRVLIAELALMGRFRLVDDPLFNRRDHDDRSIRKYEGRNARNEWINPGQGSAKGLPFNRELWEFLIRCVGSSVSLGEKARCIWYLAEWAITYNRPLRTDYKNLVKNVIRWR